jgi:hypothetical protein
MSWIKAISVGMAALGAAGQLQTLFGHGGKPTSRQLVQATVVVAQAVMQAQGKQVNMELMDRLAAAVLVEYEKWAQEQKKGGSDGV